MILATFERMSHLSIVELCEVELDKVIVGRNYLGQNRFVKLAL